MKLLTLKERERLINISDLIDFFLEMSKLNFSFHPKKKISDMRNFVLLLIVHKIASHSGVCASAVSVASLRAVCFHSLTPVVFVPLWSLAWNANVSEHVGLQKEINVTVGKDDSKKSDSLTG